MQERQESQDDSWMGLLVMEIWARSLQMPLRYSVGKNYNDGRAALALGLVVLWGAFGESLPVLIWALIYLISLICHRVGAISRAVRGERLHSSYIGYPWIGAMLGHRIPEMTVKATLEPLVAVVLGLLAYPFGEAGMFYFIGGAACMAGSTGYLVLYERKRVDDLNDAMIENQILMSELHKRRRRR